MKQDLLTLLRRCIAALSTGLAIAMLLFCFAWILMPRFGIHGTLQIGFHAGRVSQAVADLKNPFKFYASLHLSFPR